MQKRSTGHRALTILIIGTLLLFYGCKKKSKSELGIGYILSTNNFVFYKNYRSLEWENARSGLPLYRGDYIRTGDKSSASLNIEGDIIKIEENTLIRIDVRKQLTEADKGIELVILNGDISLENKPLSTSTLSIARYKDGKRITEDLNEYIKRVIEEKSLIDTGFAIKRITKLLSPCNEVLNTRNNIFKWEDPVSGVLVISDGYGKKAEYVLVSEREKHIELNDGVYDWQILEDGEIISNKCKFEVRSKDTSMKAVSVRREKARDSKISLSDKQEVIVPENKKVVSGEDIVKNRLSRIDKIIQENIESIKNTKKSIDTSRVKNYATLYNKLDELNNLLQDLKALEESIFMEIMKIENPSMIAKYLSELEDIESNLKGINKEIRSIQEGIYKNGNGEQK